MKLAVFKYEPWEREYLEGLESLKKSGVVLTFFDTTISQDYITDEKDFDGFVVFVDSSVSKDVINKFPNLKFVATRSTGYDHIDVGACKERGIIVSNVPFYGENTVAEYAFGLILAVSRRIPESYFMLKEGGKFDSKGFTGIDLLGKTIGVVGTGHIGRHVVGIAKGFGMNVLACDARPDEEFAKTAGFSYVSLEELLKNSDIISLHVPYMKETHHLINSSNIGFIKKGAVLVNTSRGAIIETDALVKALQSGHLFGVGLDVMEEESMIKDELSVLSSGKVSENSVKTLLEDHILIDMPNVIVTPHNAFNTKEALQRILNTTVENILAFINNKPINLTK